MFLNTKLIFKCVLKTTNIFRVNKSTRKHKKIARKRIFEHLNADMEVKIVPKGPDKKL